VNWLPILQGRNSRSMDVVVKDKRQLESIDSRQLESLRVFHEVARALTSNLQLEPLLRTIMAQMEDFFGPEQWSLLLMDEDGTSLRYALSSNLDDELFKDVRIPLGEGIVGWVASSGENLIVPNVATDEEWREYAIEHELNLQSIACMPIRHGSRVLGVLQLNNTKVNLQAETAVFLHALCDYTAIALENASNVDRIHKLSLTDDCTGLFNSRCLYDMVGEEIKSSLPPGANHRVRSINPKPFSLLFLDLDHFKSINDTHGHLIGSRLLAEIGGVIKRVIGPNHAAFRYGGDEFVCLLRGLDKPDALKLAEELRLALLDMKFLSAAKLAIKISGSFGLATYPEDGATLQEIVRSADTMMYHAKSEGRNRIAVADGTRSTELPPMKGSRHT
jgi:diguanylate cyclase (GGDEF)-like protein